MEIYVCNRNYFKESNTVKNAIVLAINTLYTRISSYEAQNISFSHIFNDPSVKYDKHGDFYTLKSQKSNMQLRILYSYMIIDGRAIILIADFFIKKKNSKEYIRQFDSVNHIDPMVAYSNAYPLERQ